MADLLLSLVRRVLRALTGSGCLLMPVPMTPESRPDMWILTALSHAGSYLPAFTLIELFFFAKDEQYAYFHAIWHVFILLGSLSHTAALWIVLS